MTTLSLNAPVPNAVVAVADDLSPLLSAFDRVRERHSLLVKRLGDGRLDPYRVRERLRTALAGVPPVQVRLGGLETFDRPPDGSAPVLYLSVESPGVVGIHEALREEFGTVSGLEGEAYTPHVTVARGGDVPPATLDRLRQRSVPPVEWTVDRLEVYDATYGVVAAELPLPP